MKTHIKLIALTGFLTLAVLPATAQTNIIPNNKVNIVGGHIITVDYTNYEGGKISFHTNGGGHSLGIGVHGRAGHKYWNFVDARGQEFFTEGQGSGRFLSLFKSQNTRNPIAHN